MIKKELLKTVSAFLIGVMSFLLIKPTFVQAVASEEDLSLFVANGDVEVDTKVDRNGIRQIKYKHKGKEYQVTDENYAHADPETDGEYIVWMAQTGSNWQVFLHHITSGETVQLTVSGNNVNPVISGEYVAWEGQIESTWQIYVFDGLRVKQVTFGDLPSLDVGIEGSYVIYGTKVSVEDDGWVVNLYNVETEDTTLLTPDGYGYSPTILDGLVKWTVIEDGEGVTYVYDIASDTTAKEDDWYASQRPVVEEVVDKGEVVESTDTPIEVVEESTEAVVSEEEEGTQETVLESTETTTLEEEEVLPEEPEQVTEEDIMEELGIVDSGGEEDAVEEGSDSSTETSSIDEIDAIPTEEGTTIDDSVESTTDSDSTEEVVEGTSSEGSGN